MGFLKDVREFAKPVSEEPDYVAQVVAARREPLGYARIEALLFTGEESPWQPPQPISMTTRAPKDARLEPGARFVVKTVRTDKTNPYRFVWDAPEPELPPMQFPQVPGGQNPIVMLDHLQSLVAMGALPQDGYDRAAAYLEHGWPTPA